MKQDFPLNGVIGIIANHPNELDLALESGLQCVEVRTDLLLDAGISLNQILKIDPGCQIEGSCLSHDPETSEPWGNLFRNRG